MNSILQALEARAKKLGLNVERCDATGGDKWLAIHLAGDSQHGIAFHWRDGRLHTGLSIYHVDPMALLPRARAIIDAHAQIMRCDWCGEEGIHEACAKEEAQLDAEWNREEGMAVAS